MSKQETFSRDSKRAAIYCRVSTADQSAERQVRDLEAWAKRLGYQVVGVYVEIASGMKTERKERAKILAQAQARLIDTVLVTELSRWGRSTQDLITTVRQLASHRVSTEALQGMSFDLATTQGRLMLTFFAGISEFERDLTAERTKSGLANAVAKGKKLGRPKGNKTESKHRDAVIELASHGFSSRDIASKLKISKNTACKILREAVPQ